MAIPDTLKAGLSFPAIAAPMFLVSGPELVIATCQSGMIGTFPALNQRTTEGYAQWLDEIQGALTPEDARFGVNMIVHPTNSRLMADMMVTVEKKVPLVITSLGAVRDVVDAVHSYGGVVFHDITTVRHAQKAAEAGVDGLILVCNGAGGHAGTYNPFALLGEIRQWYTGTLILSGCLSRGSDVAAALMMGADLGYMGTRFIATREAMASDGYKTMLTQSSAKDIVYTPAISGVPASFLLPSLESHGITKDMLKDMTTKMDMDHEMSDEAKAWKTLWSAGQGTGNVRDILPTSELVARLKAEFSEATQRFAQTNLV